MIDRDINSKNNKMLVKMYYKSLAEGKTEYKIEPIHDSTEKTLTSGECLLPPKDISKKFY